MRKFLQSAIIRPMGLPYLLAVVFASTAGPALAQWHHDCGSLDSVNGPFDYTSAADRAERLAIVEAYHFTREVEQLQGHNKCGNNRCQLVGDLDYTLRAFPNHHRALLAMSNYHLNELHKTERPMRYTANCYFDRALRFRPDDATVHMIFGNHQYKNGDRVAALQEFERAVELAPTSAEAHYNLGLTYAETEEYARARKHARRAYDLGFPLQGLKSKLQRAGQWDDQDTDVQANKE